MNYQKLSNDNISSINSAFVRRIWSYATTSRINDKEIRESFDFVDRIWDKVKGKRVLELSCGHGLIGRILNAKGVPMVRQVDKRNSHGRQKMEMYMFRNNVIYDQMDYVANKDEIITWDFDVVVAMHACGSLTDHCIDIAMKKNADICICPCCYHGSKLMESMSAVAKEIGKPMAIDSYRLATLAHAGYKVSMKKLNISISTCNNIIIAVKQQN